MRWVRNSMIACMGQVRKSGRHHLKELGRDEKITFKWNLKD
jgi:hypothetical protein